MIQHLDKQGIVYVERPYILRTERAESMHIRGRHEGGMRRNTRRRFMYVECMYIHIYRGVGYNGKRLHTGQRRGTH